MHSSENENLPYIVNSAIYTRYLVSSFEVLKISIPV